MLLKRIWAYAIAGIITLVFQIWIRAGQCGEHCALSFAKAVAWAVVWPISWIVYLRGLF
jgi:hypothetical protein